MAFVPTPNCARVVINFIQGTSTYSNVLHFTKDAFTGGDMNILANAVDQAVADAHLPNITANSVYVGVRVYDIRTSTGAVVFNNDNTGGGAAAGDPAPLNSAVVITLRTNTRGRTGRGRMYVAGFADAELSGFTWSTNAQQAANNYLTEIRDSAALLGWIHVIRSTQTDGVLLNPAVTREVVSFDIRSGITGTQRRRLDRP